MHLPFLYFLEGLRNPVLDLIFSVITLCGEETVFMAVGMVVFWCVNKYQGYYLLCTGFVGTAVNQFLKMLCRVPRPWVNQLWRRLRDILSQADIPRPPLDFSAVLQDGIGERCFGPLCSFCACLCLYPVCTSAFTRRQTCLFPFV